jgi:tRNA(fMet)-specific endonuclease VapC
MAYLLDTNIVSNLVRHPYGRVAQRIDEVGQEKVFTSIIVAAELHYGTERKNSGALQDQLDAILGQMDILPLDVPSNRMYAELRVKLERVGQVIGGNDMLIAAHALALGYTLVTDNLREFSRIPDLKIENWLR